MNVEGEKRQEEMRLRHEAEFRRQHNVSPEEWERAEELADAFCRKLFDKFWEIYNRGNDRPGSRKALPGNGVEDEMRPPDGPAQKGKGPQLRGTRPRREKRSR